MMKFIKEKLIKFSESFDKLRTQFVAWNKKTFVKSDKIKQLIIKYYVLDYTVKTKFLFRKTFYTFNFTRGALINWNLFCMSMVFNTISITTNITFWGILSTVFLILFFISIYINTFLANDIPLKDMLKYGDFTQLVGLDTYIRSGNSKYVITPEIKYYYNTKIELASIQYINRIENSDTGFNTGLAFMYPLIVVATYLVVMLSLILLLMK